MNNVSKTCICAEHSISRHGFRCVSVAESCRECKISWNGRKSSPTSVFCYGCGQTLFQHFYYQISTSFFSLLKLTLICHVSIFLEIPLSDGAVDAVLCDIPFGRKFSCSTDMPTALPRLLKEMER